MHRTCSIPPADLTLLAAGSAAGAAAPRLTPGGRHGPNPSHTAQGLAAVLLGKAAVGAVAAVTADHDMTHDPTQ
jgi:hypothetical protein